MSKEFINKKLRQIVQLLSEMEELLDIPYAVYKDKFTNIRTAERNFQLVVEQASDINVHISIENGTNTPDTYKDSFRELNKLEILDDKLTKELTASARLRNVIVHEYDFDEDNFIFYKSSKKYVVSYKNYIIAIEKYLNN